MSPGYLDAARALDTALGRVVDALDLADPRTLLIVAADHGGGGIVPTRHDSMHAADTTIPVLLAGGAVAPMRLGADVSLLDIPATIAWALGIPLPASYAGRPLSHAFPAVRLLASDRQVIATAPEPEYIDAVVGECSRR